MEAPDSPPVSKYLMRPIRTLATVCRDLGRDDGGRACMACPIRDLCGAQSAKTPAP